MGLKIFKCYIKALKEYFQHRVFIPHTFRDVECKKTNIIATNDNFRVSENYQHEPNETVYPGALLVTSRCICCGKEMQSWYREPWKYNKEDLWDIDR